MTALDQLQIVKLTLAKREPSTHDPKRTFHPQAAFVGLKIDTLCVQVKYLASVPANPN